MKSLNALLAMSMLFFVACKRPQKGGKTTAAAAELDGENADGSGEGPTSEGSAMPTVAPELVLRAQEIHDFVVKILDQKFRDDNGSVWSTASMELKGDWIVESPEGLWGLDADQLPKDLDCDSKNTACNTVFKRLACESDNDCAAVGTHCAPLQATVSKLGDEPQKLCLGPSDELIDRFYEVMVSAEKELDIASLSMPDGRFRSAMNHALAVLSQKQNPPAVRLLFSGYNSALPNFLNSPSKVLGDIMKDLEKLSTSAHALPMNLAWLADGKVSWNHAKIIVADGSNAIAGGHNMWDNDYLRSNPISDLSIHYSGEAAEKARDFVNVMWSKIKDNYATSDMIFGRLPEFSEKAKTAGTVSAINVGRLGTYGSNPADEAIIAMLKAAKNTALIDQQDYFNVIVTSSSLTRSFAFDAIIEAAVRGVQVTLVSSNKYPLGNYGMVDPALAYKNFIEALTERLREAKTLKKEDAHKRACELLVMAPFRINGKLKEWPNGKGVYGTHTKLVMVDDAVVYVGSQNLYPANLQEYGSIITDAGATALLKETYWDKLWTESSQVQLPCPKL